MAGTNRNRKGAKVFVVIYLVLLIGFIIPTVLSLVMTMRETVSFSVEYDKDPLVLKAVKVINRGTSYGEYEISEGNVLCEVILTYENMGWYAAEYGDTPEFYGGYDDEAEEYLSRAWLNSDSELVYEAADENPIPAGKKGSRRYFVEVWPDMTALKIEEVSDKLEGDAVDVTMKVPEKEGESVGRSW